MSELVVNGLVKRRAELAGEIEHTQQHAKKLIADLEHLDATIVQFDPDYRVEAIKPKGFRPPSDWAKRGEMTRIILDVLRQATEPLTAQDIARELMKSRGMEEDAKLLKKMTKRVGVALRGQREAGVVQSSQGPGMVLVWKLIA